jgi:predicted NBD/HSP70 family sugar kinase
MGVHTGVEQSFAAGTPSLLRAINERTVLEFIRQMGPVSRAQIARDSGLSKPTVSQALTSLLGARLVREAGRSSGGKGPTAQLYELNAKAGWVVGLQVGRHDVRAAVADLRGSIVARREARARARSSASLIEQIGEIAHAVADDAGLRWRQVTHATLGSPGVVEPGHTEVHLAHNLPGWGRQGLVEAVRAELGTNVSFENDVNLAALSEQRFGLGKDATNFVLLHIGTGIGLGLVLGGELYRGATGAAGEIGYLPFGADPATRASRRRGALEAAAGESALAEAAKAAGMTRPFTTKRIFAAARKGDERALQVVLGEAKRVALAIAAIVPVVDPELVILGGAIGDSGDALLEPVRTELRSISPFDVRLEMSGLGEFACVDGAVCLARDTAQELLFTRALTRGRLAG